MNPVKFPNLFIIGAMKAGTSSLHEYLGQHPQIFMSRMKEPQYFAPHLTRWNQAWGQGNSYPEQGVDWYLHLFKDAGNVKYAGESSVSYSARPWVEDCEKRIAKFNPASRIIYLLRDPVERAISHYWYFVRDGREDQDILTAFKRRGEYIARSNYALQLQPYLNTFGHQQVFTLTVEELNAQPQRTFQSLFEWLGVDKDVQIDTSMRFNVSDDRLLQTRRGRVFCDTMMKHWRWKLFEPRLPRAIPELLRRVTYRPVSKNLVDPSAAIEFLRPRLRRHTDALEILLGKQFPEWTTLDAQSNPESVSRTAAKHSR